MLFRGKSSISQELDSILMCKELKWDYYTYLNQPSWFIEGMREVMNLDTSYFNSQMKKK